MVVLFVAVGGGTSFSMPVFLGVKFIGDLSLQL
jgi:hypothetical protein